MPVTRIPFNTLAIAFGLAGVAQAWSAAAAVSDLSPVVPQVFWGITLVALVWLVVAHLVRGRRAEATLRDQLRDPVQGPLAAIVPIVAMLLGADLYRFWPFGGVILTLLAILAALLLASWLLSRWLNGGVELGAVHGGYLLPTGAGGLIAASTATAVGLPDVGWAAFGVAVLFCILMTGLIIARLISRPALPDPLVPTLAVVMAPPAVAGLALIRLTDGAVTPFSLGMLGLTVVMVIAQLALIPRYRRLPFTLGFWSFTFPSAAVVAYAIFWLPAAAIPLAVFITLGVLAIAIRSLLRR